MRSVRVYGGVGVERHTFINLEVDIGKWKSSFPNSFFFIAQQIVQRSLNYHGFMITHTHHTQ